MTTTNKKRHEQLGMPFGTAQNRLRKMILFEVLREAKLNICFQCGGKIETIEELSIEHRVPWLDSNKPIENFFDLGNIGFSHLSCNCRAARHLTKGNIKHGCSFGYDKKGCRCEECREYKSKVNAKRKR